ncbi:hypothetical protein QE152_g2021 [Popillia japonica]|uniref:Uncharacterized protein n=1 Tax=Popillia japonica TaxID=7064 RepID=A0AAW1N4D5_POPJA
MKWAFYREREDESMLNLWTLYKIELVRRKQETALKDEKNLKSSTVNHGDGSVFVRGCITVSANWFLSIKLLTSKYVYLDILKENLNQSAAVLIVSGHYYHQQDNDSKHKSYLVHDWLL